MWGEPGLANTSEAGFPEKVRETLGFITVSFKEKMEAQGLVHSDTGLELGSLSPFPEAVGTVVRKQGFGVMWLAA